MFHVTENGSHFRQLEGHPAPADAPRRLEALTADPVIWGESAPERMEATQVLKKAKEWMLDSRRNGNCQPFRAGIVPGSQPQKASGAVLTPLQCCSCAGAWKRRRTFGHVAPLCSQKIEHGTELQKYMFAKLLTQYSAQSCVTMQDFNAAVGSHMSLRNDQAAACAIFDLASRYGGGIRKGVPKPREQHRDGRGRKRKASGEPLCLELTLDKMPAAHKDLFGLNSAIDQAHPTDSEDGCTWRGIAVYCPASQEMRVHAGGEHDVKGQSKGGRILTTDQAERLKQNQAKQSSGRLVSLNHCAASPPLKRQEQHFQQREAKKRRTQARDLPHRSHKRVFMVADMWDLHENLCIPHVDGATKPDDLVIVDQAMYVDDKGKKQFTVLYSSKTLLDTPKKLENKQYIKVRADATFKEHERVCVTLRVPDDEGGDAEPQTI